MEGIKTYTLEVSDDYVTEIQASGDAEAIIETDRVAIQHGDLVDVFLYRGPMVSGVRPMYVASTDGRGNLL